MTKIEITKEMVGELKNFPIKYGEGHIESRCGETYWVLEEALPIYEIKFRGDLTPL